MKDGVLFRCNSQFRIRRFGTDGQERPSAATRLEELPQDRHTLLDGYLDQCHEVVLEPLDNVPPPAALAFFTQSDDG